MLLTKTKRETAPPPPTTSTTTARCEHRRATWKGSNFIVRICACLTYGYRECFKPEAIHEAAGGM